VILRRAEEIHKSFTDLVLRGGTLADIARLLATLQGNPVSIHTPRFIQLAFGEPAKLKPAVVTQRDIDMIRQAAEDVQLLSECCGKEGGSAALEQDGVRKELFVYPMRAAGETYGFIIIWLVAGKEYDLNVLEQAVTIIALELLKQRAVTDVERRFKSYFIEEIIQGKIRSRAEIISRGKGYGWDLTARYLPILIELDDYLDMVTMRAGNLDPISVQKHFWNVVSKSIMFHAGDAITVDIGARIFILLKCESAHDGKKIREAAERLVLRIQNEIAAHRPLSVTAGIGRVVDDILELGTGFSQAEKALRTGQIVHGTGSMTHFDNLGIYRLLDVEAHNPELSLFARELLGELLKSDEVYHTDFIKTLEILFKCNFNLKKASNQMLVHYNTIRYRVQKIEQMTGMSLDSEDDRFNLQLAYKLLKMEAR
ncbi:MAG: helix-turn-helix domain-containing protein, partial [Rectinema sp.]|nr:helix-turn-helix domain-containing protein [Rectinema sp.]